MNKLNKSIKNIKKKFVFLNKNNNLYKKKKKIIVKREFFKTKRINLQKG